MYKTLLTAGAAMLALGTTTQALGQDPPQSPGVTKQDLGVNNKQTVIKPAADPSVVDQYAGPGSHDNVQSATTSSTGASPNTIIQSTEGGGSVQTAIQTGGSGNVVVQTQQGSGNQQTVTQSGDGNRATQSQSGRNLRGTLDQPGGQTDTQIQR